MQTRACLFEFTQLTNKIYLFFEKAANIRNGAVKKPAPGILFLIVSRHADGKCFQKQKYPAVENYMYSHNVALIHSFENMFYGFE